MSDQLGLFEAPVRAPVDPQQALNGKAGMQQAIDHAEAVDPSWPETALAFLRRFADQHRGHRGAEFLGEDVRHWAEQHGCPLPPDKRSWGAVIQKAARAKIILNTGRSAKARLSGNDSRWSPLWRANPEGVLQ
jgi:hypothetical protein